MQQTVYSINNFEENKGTVDLSQNISAQEKNDDLIWQLVNSSKFQRITTKNTKNRSDKRGGGKKPWRQKGTGRARAGTIRSPIWVGGGITFSHESRVCKHKINKKMFRKGIANILSQIIASGNLIVVDNMEAGSSKSKEIRTSLKGLLETRKILLLTEKIDENFLLASRNFFELCYGEWRSLLSPELLCNANKVVITKNALSELEEWLA